MARKDYKLATEVGNLVLWVFILKFTRVDNQRHFWFLPVIHEEYKE